MITRTRARLHPSVQIAVVVFLVGTPHLPAQPVKHACTQATVDLVDFGAGSLRSQLTTRGVSVTQAADALIVTGALPASEGSVRFTLEPRLQDLSRFRYIEAEIQNTGSSALRFTFWALAGHGWGGASTYTPEVGPAAGREMLAPGQSGVFRIDLHTRYPGPDVYTPATNPAAIRWLELIVGDGRSAPSLRVSRIRATGEGPPALPGRSRRVIVPDISSDPPGPGRRVFQQLPRWTETEITHVLTLPREWRPGRRYPVIVEYTGNIFYHKFCHSTGETAQGNLAYGLARGEKFICLNLPFVSLDGRREQVDGWGDIAKTADYCVEAVEFVCAQYGGDPSAVFFVGFSRGEYAANYLALRDDRIASLWFAFVGTNPGRTWNAADGTGWKNVGLGWDERAARLRGRPWFAAPANLGAGVHVDVEYLEDRPSTVATRQWMQELLLRRSAPESVPGGAAGATRGGPVERKD